MCRLAHVRGRADVGNQRLPRTTPGQIDQVADTFDVGRARVVFGSKGSISGTVDDEVNVFANATEGAGVHAPMGKRDVAHQRLDISRRRLLTSAAAVTLHQPVL